MDLLSCTCYLVMTLASQHINPSGLNQTNPGIGIEYNRWVAGEYYNSFHRHSTYFGREVGVDRAHWHVGVMVGAITGYQRRAGDQNDDHYGNSPGWLSPAVAPYISYTYDRVGVNITFIPNPTDWQQSAFGLQLKYQVGAK